VTEPSDTPDALKGQVKRSRNSARPWEHLEDADRAARCECPSPLIDVRDLEDGVLTCTLCGRGVKR
jgi:hypothetical protein